MGWRSCPGFCERCLRIEEIEEEVLRKEKKRRRSGDRRSREWPQPQGLGEAGGGWAGADEVTMGGKGLKSVHLMVTRMGISRSFIL